MLPVKIRIVFSIFLALLICPGIVIAQNQRKISVSGYVSDIRTGERLAGVTVKDLKLKTGTSSEANGAFSLILNQGDFELQFSYIGYKTVTEKGNSLKDITLNIKMEEIEKRLDEVVIEGKKSDENVKANEMSLLKLDVKTIKMVPSLLGETDLVKVLQLMPGVQSTSEGATGFSVRGGSADQNLIILDDATIYNASHLMGFFSVFNNDAVKEVTLYKGDIPASYGGRLSSLLDVKIKEGNLTRIGGTGSIGTVSSKLTLEGPIIKDKTTFLIGGRRTYADLFLPFAKDPDVRDNKLYFYDLNLKLSQVINQNNRLFLSAYSGRDIFKNQYSGIGFGNQTATLRWNHIISSKLFFNFSISYSKYNYDIGTPESDPNPFKWESSLEDYSARFEFTHFLNPKHKLKYGVSSIWHNFFPGSVYGIGSTNSENKYMLPSTNALEHGIYLTDDYQLNEKLSLKYGARISVFQSIGPGTSYRYDDEHNPVDSIVYRRGDIYNTWTAFEPRLAFTWVISKQSSVKGSYSHTAQFVSLTQNSTAGTPLDIWFPASPNVKPQFADQVAAGYFRNIKDNTYETSVELYYKDINQLIDFRDHAQLFLNPYLEGELRIGDGYAYGAEFLVRKNEGKFFGWISYTYSRSFRIVPEINEGRKYSSPYDKPHNVNVVVNYDFARRFALSATWIYATGLPVTFPTGRAVVGNAILPIYSNRNDYRMPDYHRLDLSLTLKGKEKPGRRWYNEFNLSLYNVYNRHNTWSINFVQDSANQNVTYAEQTYLFSVIPALTYNMRF